MLYFIGLGLNSKQLTKEADFALKEAEAIYVEAYTSVYSEGSIKDLEDKYSKEFKLVYREKAETNFTKIIDEARSKIVVFAVYGNITSATTHSMLIDECMKENIDFKLIPGISIFSVVSMLTGLQEYRFGRTVSIVKPEENYTPISFFNWIEENRERGLHTLCLLDIKIDENSKYFMQPYEAAKRLIEIGNKQGINVKDRECVVITGAGSKSFAVFKTTLDKLSKFITDHNVPSSIVVYGNLQMDEQEFLENLDSY